MKRFFLVVLLVLAAAGLSAQEKQRLFLTPYAGGMVMFDNEGGGISSGGPTLGDEIEYAISGHWGAGLRTFGLLVFDKTEGVNGGWGGASVAVHYYIHEALSAQANLGFPSGLGVTIGRHTICLEGLPAQDSFVLQLTYGYKFGLK